ncbi:MAG: hypothetical protein JNM61_09440 [Zoogloeaceae bacterium]|nr:hypothetical protein [Zoogloeaceae bacterium]
MSNRPRRQWLGEQRLRAVVEAGIKIPADEFTKPMAEWNRWLRSAFRFVVQSRTEPAGLDLLNGNPEEWPEDWEQEIDGLDLLRSGYEEAVELLDRARNGLEPMRRVARMKFAWDMWIYDRCEPGRPLDDFVDTQDPAAQYQEEVTDFTAAIYRATRILRGKSLEIHQHAPRHKHATTAARNVLLRGTVTRERASKSPWRPVPSGRFLNDEAVLPEAALLRVLALGAAERALKEFRRIAEGVVTHGDAIDLGDYECAASHLKDAGMWSAEADRSEATIQEEANRIAIAAVIKADARIVDAAQRKAIDLVSSRKEDEKKAESEHMANIRKLRDSSRSEALPEFISELRKANPSGSIPDIFNEAVRRIQRDPVFTYYYAGRSYQFIVTNDGHRKRLESWIGLRDDGEPDGASVLQNTLYKWEKAKKTLDVTP